MNKTWQGPPELDGPKVDAGKGLDSAMGKIKVKAGKVIVKGMILSTDLGYISDLERVVYYDPAKTKAEFHFGSETIWKVKENKKGELERFIQELHKGLEGLSITHEVKKSNTGKIVAYVVGALVTLGIIGAIFSDPDKAEDGMPDIVPKYKVVRDNEDLSYANVDRKRIRISVPAGLSRKELEDNIKHAAWSVFKESKFNAIAILAYRAGDPIDEAPTAGMADLAPNGVWADAGSNSPMMATVKLSELYFKKIEPTFAIDEKVKLKDEDGSGLGISNKFGSWMEKDFIVKVPNGSIATIKEVRKKALTGDVEMVRYKVEVIREGKVYSGWVHDSDFIH